ncbi:MAG: hypothetical protein MJ240_00350 [Kiritimatiellae bacterium]|nr:hypothetical protein [Kiritimatiellia bacterium]
MMAKSFSTFSMAVLAAVCVLRGASAASQTAYLKGTDDVGYSAMTNAAKWGIGSATGAALGAVGQELPADCDYVVQRLGIRTPFYDFTFPGASLTLTDGATFNFLQGSVGRTYTFPNLILAGGTMMNLAGSQAPTVKGSVTVTAPETAPFTIADIHASPAITIDAAVHGDSSAALWLYARRDHGSTSWKNTNSTICFTDDALADYAGLITVAQFMYMNRSLVTSAVIRAELRSGNVVSPARVEVRRHCHVGALDADDVANFQSLALADEAVLDVPCAGGSAGVLKVAGTFTRAGKVKVNLLRTAALTGDRELPILVVPAGSTLSLDDFELVAPLDIVADLQVHENEAGLPTLFLRWWTEAIIQKVADAYTSVSKEKFYTFYSGDHWENGEEPRPDRIYRSDLEMRNDSPTGTVTRFAGRALLKSGSFDLFGDLTIDDLRLCGGTSITAYSLFCSISGCIIADSSLMAGNNLSFPAMNKRTTTVYASIVGDRNVNVATSASATETDSSKLQMGYVRLMGDNSRHTGSYNFYNNLGSAPRVDWGPIVSVGRAEALGGPMPAWTYNGHRLQHYTQLVPLATMTLDRQNCGFMVDGPSYIVCSNGVAFTLRERICWKGLLTKKGEGTLALGGPAPTFGTATGTTPTADQNRLVVAEGALKVDSAEAFQGTQVEMAEGTELIVNLPTEVGSALATYGLKNTLWDNALLLPEGGVTVRIEDASGATQPATGGSRPIRVPICTVSATAAARVRGRLRLAKSPYAGYGLTLQETVNGDGSVTFAVLFQKGTMILFR